MKKYAQLFKMFLSRYLTYRARIFIWIFTDSSQFFLFPFLWIAILANNTLPAGYDLPNLVTYYVIMAVISSGFISHCSRHVRTEIIDGMVSRRLVVPFSYFWFIIMAEVSYKYISGIIAGASIVLLYVFGRHWFVFPESVTQWGFFLLSVGVMFIISHFLEYLIGLSAFWMGDITALHTVKEVLADVFSGRLAPLTFFILPIQQFANFLPFKYLAYIPAQIYIGNIKPTDAWSILAPALAWIVVLGIVIMYVWHRGLRKHEGFGI